MPTNADSLVASGANGHSPSNDVLYALSDEQILEIEPEKVGQPFLPAPSSREGAVQDEDAAKATPAVEARVSDGRPDPSTPDAAGKSTQAGAPSDSAQGKLAPQEPPKWLADMMADPQAGGEARDFWTGILQARQESAAYREVFAKPEEARAAADRSRQLGEIDKLYFAGDTATREQLAQTLLQQDPATFREMVFAGLKALGISAEQLRPARTTGRKP